MAGSVLAILFVLVVPLGLMLRALGLLRSPVVRLVFASLAAVGVALSFPFDGLSPAEIERLKLFVGAAAAGIVGLRALDVWKDRRTYLAALTAAAVAAVVIYLNFFAFHGEHRWMHLHDVAHYYLGSRYAPELDYGDLYVAVLQAEAEAFDGVFWARRARDLRVNRVEHVSEIVRRGETVKSHFSADRWRAFVEDVRFFRQAMGSRFAGFVRDHGYNPTPVWSLIGGSIANLVPPGNATGIFLLTLLDPLLLLATFGVIGWVFGAEGMLLAVIYVAIFYGAAFGWVGGAFLRFLWFSCLVTAVALRRVAPGTAGLLLAVAIGLRVFPVLLAVGPVAAAAGAWARDRRIAPDRLRFLASLGLSGVGLFLATVGFAGGIDEWQQFRANMAVHVQSASSNLIGITSWLSYVPGIDVTEPGGLDRLIAWRDTAYRLQLVLLFLPALAYVAWRSPRLDAVDSMVLGVVLVVTSLNLSAYYGIFLVVLVLAWIERPWFLLLPFTVELGVHALHLVEPAAVMIYLYKSALVGWLALAVVLATERKLSDEPTALR